MPRARTSQPALMPHAVRTLASMTSSLVSLPRIWLWRLHCRHELTALTPEQMRDVGLDAEAVTRESRKPFWEA